jgi:acyl-CoA synthetase (AMP-forming)/AMP-acid ligase II
MASPNLQAIGSMTTAPHDHPIAALIAQAARRGGAEALVFPAAGGRLTYAQWLDRALRIAGGLSALGLGRGDPIALLAENRLDWPVVQMAAAALGALFVPLNTHYRTDDLAVALDASEAKAIFLSERFRSNPYLDNLLAARPSLPALRHVISLDGGRAGQDVLGIDDLARHAPITQPVTADPPRTAGALLFTSGTTGKPKGALLQHAGMMMCARQTSERLGLRAGDRWTSIIPLFHCAGCILNIQGALQAGGAYVGQPAFEPESLFKLIESERCTALSGVPTSYLAMLQHPARRHFDLSSLRTGTCGGADANPEVLKACAREFPMPGLAHVYGQTEGSTLLTASAHDEPERFHTVGRALPGYEIRIADPQSLEPLPAGSIGEVQGRGPMVMLGYHANPEATAETITADGWLRTGDMGYLEPSGHLVIAGGRLRDMIIRGGENIYPVEIETLYAEHPAVTEIAVFGEPDEYYGEIVAAAVRLRAKTTVAELTAFAGDRIARFKVPVRFYVLERFPLTPSGKIRKVELREMARAKRLDELD